MPPRFNPFDEAFRRDPYPVYRALRTEDPVHRSFLDAWVVTRHADVKFVLKDSGSAWTRFPSASPNAHRFVKARGGDLGALLSARAERFFFFLDPPTHTRLRGLVRTGVLRERRGSHAVHPHGVYRPPARRPEGSRSFRPDRGLCGPLPVFVIASMLGVRDADLKTLKGWSLDLSRILDPLVSLEEYQQMDDIVRGFEDCFREIFAARRRQPADDIISVLLSGAQGHDDLQERDLAAICTLLFITGEETTVNLIGNGMLSLQRHPDAWARLRDEPDLVGHGRRRAAALRESRAAHDTRGARGSRAAAAYAMRAGDKIVVGIGAANRDPEVFEQPDELRLDRQPEPARRVRRRHPLLPRRDAGQGAGVRRRFRGCCAVPDAQDRDRQPPVAAQHRRAGAASS